MNIFELCLGCYTHVYGNSLPRGYLATLGIDPKFQTPGTNIDVKNLWFPEENHLEMVD